MNDCFKRLWADAEKWADAMYSHSDPRWLENQKAKFAELVVNECLGMCKELEDRYSFHGSLAMFPSEKEPFEAGKDACQTIQVKIRKHFGVEE